MMLPLKFQPAARTMPQSCNFPTLEVDLAAMARNYGVLRARLKTARCGAVVKANAYGLGIKAIAPALHDAGCRDFFVATLEEGIELRKALQHRASPATLYVFHGARAGERKDFLRHRLMPVLSSVEQMELWNDAGPCALHVDTGMNRLGIAPDEIPKALGTRHKAPLILSHLACADEREHPKNKEQLHAFRAALAHFPQAKASLANSSGIFLGAPYHFDLARPGSALYGIGPTHARKNPVENVVSLSAPVLQYRCIGSAQTVGYGAARKVRKGTALATVELGYADGFMRYLSDKAEGIAAGLRVPVVGRVSMDMVSVDVTAVPEHLRTPDLRITFIGKELPVDTVATQAGTIGYEIFTRMGARVRRIYRD